MTEERKSLEKNKTWVLVDLPKNHRVVGCKWIFKRKGGIRGVEKAIFKSRLVARGFSQVEVVDFNEIFSLMVMNWSNWMLRHHSFMDILRKPYTCSNLRDLLKTRLRFSY